MPKVGDGLPQYVPRSSVAWVGSSRAEILQARQALRSMRPAGVLDELGFLTLLGVFSDRFYPRLSTVMTRARYFIFIPAIFRALERESRSVRRNAERYVEQRQRDLCKALVATDESQPGIIGKLRAGDVVIHPSRIYWSGLRELEIYKAGVSEAALLRDIAAAGTDGGTSDDDGTVHESDAASTWHPECPTDAVIDNRTNEFTSKLSLELTVEEAEYLLQRILRREENGPPSLLGHRLQALRRGQLSLDVWPWETTALPASLQRSVEHARRLSRVARGTQLQYHAMLFELRPEDEDTGTFDAFSDWWEASYDDLRSWDLDEFAQLDGVARLDQRQTLRFLRDWVARVLRARTAHQAFNDDEARREIRLREMNTRPTKPRLPGGFHLKEWRPPASYKSTTLFGLEYRQGIGNQMVRDIAAGLGVSA